MKTRIFIILLIALLVAGCYPDRPESPTTGHLEILIPESAAPPLIREVRDFMGVYGDHGAQVTYRVVQSQEAVSRFLLDTARLIFSTEPLRTEEADLVRKLAGSLASIVVAYDGIVAAVHYKNPVEKISTEELRDILSGSVTRWEQLKLSKGKQGRIEVILQDSSDAARYLERNILNGSAVKARHTSPGNSLEVLQEVVTNVDRLAFVGLGWIDSARVPAKALEVFASEPMPDTSFAPPPEALGRYHSPHPANIYRNYYPLKRALYMYTKSLRGDLASGFGTYVATKEGQKIFLETGLVPATQPIRLRR